MNIKNYTSGVPVDRTISKIEQALAAAGASGISKDYKNGVVDALSFRVNLPNGRPVDIRLPANNDAVYQSLKATISRPRPGTLEKLKDQAMRTSWKLMEDWCLVQLSLIKLQKVDFMQVFLPYVWDGKQTFYSALKANNYQALLPAPKGVEIVPNSGDVIQMSQ